VKGGTFVGLPEAHMKTEEILKMDREEAIEVIMIEYGDSIKRLVYTYIKDYSLTEDFTQEIFLTVYLKLDTFAGRSSLKTWVYTIAINKCKDYLRSWHFRKMNVSNSILDFIGTSKGPENEVIAQADRSELISELLKLPVKYREVMILFYYKEFSLQEISTVLNISEGSVKVRLHRGREGLKKRFDIVGRGDVNGRPS
jgi:RNA polymerase sigma-70 factor, ECF subfamily